MCAYHQDTFLHGAPTPPSGSKGAGHIGGWGPCDIVPSRTGEESSREFAEGAGEEARGEGAFPKSQIKNKTGPSVRREGVRGSLWPAASLRDGSGETSPPEAARRQTLPSSQLSQVAHGPCRCAATAPSRRPSDFFTLGSSLLVNISHQLIRKIVSKCLFLRSECCCF